MANLSRVICTSPGCEAIFRIAAKHLAADLSCPVCGSEATADGRPRQQPLPLTDEQRAGISALAKSVVDDVFGSMAREVRQAAQLEALRRKSSEKSALLKRKTEE